MLEPSELEQLVVPYCEGRLDGSELRSVEAELEVNPEFKARVDEFAATLAMFGDAGGSPDLSCLDGIEDRIYRELVGRRTREDAHVRRAQEVPVVGGRFARVWGRVGFGAAGLVATCLVAVGFVVTRGPAPLDHDAVASIHVRSNFLGQPVSGSRHERFRQDEIARSISEAELVLYGRGDASTAVAIMRMAQDVGGSSTKPWTSDVALAEMSSVYRAASVRRGSGDLESIFGDGIAR